MYEGGVSKQCGAVGTQNFSTLGLQLMVPPTATLLFVIRLITCILYLVKLYYIQDISSLLI